MGWVGPVVAFVTRWTRIEHLNIWTFCIIHTASEYDQYDLFGQGVILVLINQDDVVCDINRYLVWKDLWKRPSRDDIIFVWKTMINP